MTESALYELLQETTEECGLTEIPDSMDTSRCRCEMCVEEMQAEIKDFAQHGGTGVNK